MQANDAAKLRRITERGLISGFSVFTDTKFSGLGTVYQGTWIIKTTNKKRGNIAPT